MPTVGTMTDFLPPSPAPSPSRECSPSEKSSGSSTPPSMRRRRRYVPQPTFHLNIGRVEVPRSLPPVRSLGTQTDESALREKSEGDKKWNRRFGKWCSKYMMPILRTGVAALGFILGRVGFGFRLR